MKKIILLTIMGLFVFASGFAQKSNRTSAYMYLQRGKLEQAKKAIDLAVKNPKTINDAKTWLYYGQIYYGIASSPFPAYRKLDTNAGEKALAGLKKAKTLDVKKRFQKEVNSYIAKLSTVFYSDGANSFKTKDYSKALIDFKDAFNVAQILGKMDTTAAFNVGISGVLANQPKIAADYLKKCIAVNFKDPKVFIYYARSLKQLGDTSEAQRTLEMGRKRFPNNLGVLLEQAQLYLEQGESDQLIANLKEAILKKPNNPSNANFYFLIGKSYDNKGDHKSAKEYYKKALVVNPKFFEAYYNIGAIYVNNAAKLQKKANNLPLSKEKEYKTLNNEANSNLDLAMPWLEKALVIRPGDKSTIAALKETYTRLKLYGKLKQLLKK